MIVDSKVSPPSAQEENASAKESEPKTSPPSVVSKEPSACGVYGLVKWYNCKFNYGFISRLDNKQDLFVHRNGIKKCNPKKFKSLMDGDIVMFDVYESDKGAEARNVTGPEGKPARPSRYAKFRPWYLEILRKTRNLSMDEKSDERPPNIQYKGKPRTKVTTTTTRTKSKINTEKIDTQPKSSQNSESNEESITAVEKPNEAGYTQRTSNDAHRKHLPRKHYQKNKQRPQTPAPAVSECHSCAMCDKAATAVEV